MASPTMCATLRRTSSSSPPRRAARRWTSATSAAATLSVSRGRAYTRNVGGGAISAIDEQAEVNSTNTSKASIGSKAFPGNSVTLKSAGQVAVKSDSSMDTHVYANAEGGGAGAG